MSKITKKTIAEAAASMDVTALLQQAKAAVEEANARKAREVAAHSARKVELDELLARKRDEADAALDLHNQVAFCTDEALVQLVSLALNKASDALAHAEALKAAFDADVNPYVAWSNKEAEVKAITDEHHRKSLYQGAFDAKNWKEALKHAKTDEERRSAEEKLTEESQALQRAYHEADGKNEKAIRKLVENARWASIVQEVALQTPKMVQAARKAAGGKPTSAEVNVMIAEECGIRLSKEGIEHSFKRPDGTLAQLPTWSTAVREMVSLVNVINRANRPAPRQERQQEPRNEPEAPEVVGNGFGKRK